MLEVLFVVDFKLVIFNRDDCNTQEKLETMVLQNLGVNKVHRPIRLTQCCTQFKSRGVKILCVLYLHYYVAFTFK